MQRVAPKFALVYLALSTPLTVGCMDQSRQDQALAAMENARHESARDTRLQGLEREHAFLMQQVASLTAANQTLTAQMASKEDEQDKRLVDLSMQLGTMSQTITALRQDEHGSPSDPPDDDSNQARNAAIRKVQTLIDDGRVTITMRNGRIQLSPARLFDVARPRQPIPAKPAPVTPVIPPPAVPPPVVPPPKRPVDRLGF